MAEIKCVICHRKFGDGEQVVPILRYVVNEKRGDFVNFNPTGYIHLDHLR